MDCDLVAGYPPMGFSFGAYAGQLDGLDTPNMGLGYGFRDGFIGTETFTYQLQPTSGPPSNLATITVTADPPPKPTCSAGSATTRGGESVEVMLTCSTSSGFANTMELVSAPAHGSVSEITQPVADSPRDGALRYTPAPGYEGPDSFTYRARNVSGFSAAATVSVSVTAPMPPLHCSDQTLTIVSEHVLSVPLSCDAPPAGFQNHFFTFNGPQHGQLGAIDHIAGTVSYTPDAGYEGPDSFNFNAISSETPVGGGGWGLVAITVKPQPAPVCAPVDLQDV